MNKIGLIARSDNTGLGIQTHEFYKHIKPQKTLVVDVSALNKLEQHHYRYPNCTVTTHEISTKQILDFLDDLSVVFCCETPYNYDLFKIARKRGIKIILQYNYEFLAYKNKSKEAYPDIFAAPSTWQLDETKKLFENVMHLPVPVNRELLPFSPKKQFKRFLHIAGTSAIHDRNGTLETLQAFASLNRDDIQLVVRCFNKEVVKSLEKFQSNSIILNSHNTLNYEHNYMGFDALILPRKYGGLCLPMQEALSCGMPVIMPAILPNTDVLPHEWLTPVGKNFNFHASYPITVHQPDVKAMADKINWLADMDEETCLKNSHQADKIAQTLDWKIWEENYLNLLTA